MGRMYYGMPSAQQCKDAAIEYQNQEVKDERLFKRFLHRYHRLGNYTVYTVTSRNLWLTKIDLKEREHTACIGIYKAFITIPKDLPPKYIARRVLTYVRDELFKTYRYVKSEDTTYQRVGPPAYLDDPQDSIGEVLTDETYTPSGSTELADYKAIPTLSERDGNLIHMIYVDGLTRQEASKSLKISSTRVKQLLERIHKKIKKYVKK
jgi:RNA polymerase sigma factor (sigma-70 family)